MLEIFKRTFKNRLVAVIITTSIAILFVVMYAALFPQIKEQSEELMKIMEAYPDSFNQAFNLESQSAFQTFEGFMSIEYFNMLWPIILLVVAIPAGVQMVAKEVETGTLGILLSLPVERWKIFVAKYFAGALQVFIYTVISILVIIPVAKIVGFDVTTDGYFVLLVLSLLLGLAILSLATFFSTISTRAGIANAVTLGIVIAMFSLRIFSQLNDDLEFLKWGSFFYYYDYNSALVDLKISFESIIIFSVTILGGFLGSLGIFIKKDFSV